MTIETLALVYLGGLAVGGLLIGLFSRKVLRSPVSGDIVTAVFLWPVALPIIAGALVGHKLRGILPW